MSAKKKKKNIVGRVTYLLRCMSNKLFDFAQFTLIIWINFKIYVLFSGFALNVNVGH